MPSEAAYLTKRYERLAMRFMGVVLGAILAIVGIVAATAAVSSAHPIFNVSLVFALLFAAAVLWTHLKPQKRM
ncbi:hypothetical protein CIT26_14525 [Mesorhizobium temperatum]|uniref:Uncharacterized protein n=2 Tax=Mesorhizobium temperatum TaxID=241416 RepID=A0A271LLT4_9HYPH|nr:hypothetical protein CIT26_14525 [Mesorhizobium temperatum]